MNELRRTLLRPPLPTPLVPRFAIHHATQSQAALDAAKTLVRMLALHPEQNITARPIAHLFREILAESAQALTLARFLLGRRRRLSRPTPLPVMPILLTPTLTSLIAGSIGSTCLDSTPARRRFTALQAAIMRPRMHRNEPTFTTLQ